MAAYTYTETEGMEPKYEIVKSVVTVSPEGFREVDSSIEKSVEEGAIHPPAVKSLS